MSGRQVGGIAPERLSKEVCAENFADLVAPLKPNEARVAAERCLFCYDAPCVTACPTAIDIPLFIRQISTGQPIAAAETIFKSNILGSMCARVCPTETLCEGACVKLTSETRPVEIGRLQRFATDWAFTTGRQFYRAGASTGRKVAVVGAGPASLACAHGLARGGHQVTIFEGRPKGGGLNEYGIAAYKVNGDIAQRELEYILAVGGISIEFGKALGRDFGLERLLEGFDAVFLGLGLGATNDLGIETGITGVQDAIEFIAELRQAPDKSAVPVGRNVVVVGGGMTAIDAATQAKLLGAEVVTIVYRRDKTKMPASKHEQDVAQTRGVLIREAMRPITIESADGAVTGITLEYTYDDGGKLVGTGERITLPADQIIVAIGQVLKASDLENAGLAMRGGRIAVDEDRRTSIPRVWAGGDCVAGGLDLTVAAVEDGKRAAASINTYLTSAAEPHMLTAGE